MVWYHDRGRAMAASKAIEAGTTVIREYPMFITFPHLRLGHAASPSCLKKVIEAVLLLDIAALDAEGGGGCRFWNRCIDPDKHLINGLLDILKQYIIPRAGPPTSNSSGISLMGWWPLRARETARKEKNWCILMQSLEDTNG
ncbi:hypothetical protein HD806DRAFT_518091 [Xylariaceae sp. AK1471]|nr:hypothetical protein HD806DRAFT_518091 [Xylariaceae sp. AK1471]